MAYSDYESVPWYRRSWVNNLFVLLGLLGCFPLAIWASYNLLTGDVYFNRRDQEGKLKTWGFVNKVWACVVAAFWSFLFVCFMIGLVRLLIFGPVTPAPA